MRIKSIQYSFITFFILLGFCLYYLQIVKGPLYRGLSYRNSIRLLNITGPRGIIYDTKKRGVALNELSFGVFIVPQEVEDFDAEINALSEILGVSESLLKRNYKRNYQAPFAPCELIRDISKRDAIIIEELKLDMQGVLVKEIPLRRYPYKEALAHVIGYIGEIDRRELFSLKSYGYRVKDFIGKAGIEKVADNFLRGKNGGMQIQVNNRGQQVKVLNVREPREGRDVYLTIDAQFQLFIWRMMRSEKGAAIFMDPRNGEILSLVSSPSYDPNISLADVLNAEDSPLLNRAIMGQYPPGSLFKLVVALAGLESGKILADQSFQCRGKLDIGSGEFNCWNLDGHGNMALRDAIIQSCNVYFYNTGILLGVEKICEYAKLLGFSKKTGIELFGETKGLVPSRVWKRIEKGEGWFTGDTANLSIGQGYLLATPLQVVRMIACVANGGMLVEPHVVKGVGETWISGHKNIRLKIKKENLDIIRDAMRGVVEDRHGTGRLAWNSYVTLSGKTGTSQVGGDLRPHAWFGGFAPSENPEISFVIFLEHGGSGGDIAALMVRKAMEYWFIHKK